MDYSPDTGEWFWKQTRNGKATKNKQAGYLINGYRSIMVEGYNYQSSRLAVLWMTGRFPNEQVDHINGKRDDDRWLNLRECSNAQNNQNRPSKNYCKIHNGTYVVYIDSFGKRIHIGTFKTEPEAKEAAKQAKNNYHRDFANHLERWPVD